MYRNKAGKVFIFLFFIVIIVVLIALVALNKYALSDNEFKEFTLPVYLYRIQYFVAIISSLFVLLGLITIFNKSGLGIAYLIIGLFFFYCFKPEKEPLSKQEKIALLKQRELQREQQKRDDEINNKRLEEEKFRKELDTFLQNKIPDLNSAIKETQRMSEEIKDKRAKLTKVLQQLGRDYRKDDDIIRYDELLTKLDKAKIEYDEMLKEGYLQYKKFEISSDPAYEKILDNYNIKAKQSLNENIDSFNKMRNQLSEIKNNE